jgi:hypothetical protein
LRPGGGDRGDLLGGIGGAPCLILKRDRCCSALLMSALPLIATAKADIASWAHGPLVSDREA